MNQEIKDKIDEKVESYSFRVPYDGSNKFYDEDAAKHFSAGASFGYSLAQAELEAAKAKYEAETKRLQKIIDVAYDWAKTCEEETQAAKERVKILEEENRILKGIFKAELLDPPQM